MNKINSKNKFLWLYVLVVIILSTLYVLPIFREGGIIGGDDIIFHSTRLKMLAEEIQSKNYFPLIYHKMFCEYGYAAGLFYPSLFLYPFAVLKVLGISIVNCLKLYYITINILTGLSFFFCARVIFKDKSYKNYNLCGFLVFVISLLDPYKFYNYYGRAALGEFTAIIFAPIIVLGVYYIFKYNKKSYILALGMIGLLNCHMVSFIIACIVLIVIYFYNIKRIIRQPKILLQTVFAALQCALISMPIWLPMIEMLIKTDLLVSHSASLFVGPLYFHCLIHLKDDNALGIILIILLITYSVLKTDKYNRAIQLSLLSVFFISDLFPWKILSLITPISAIQFPWRFSSIFFFSIIYYVYMAVNSIINPYQKIKKDKNNFFQKINLIESFSIIISISCIVLYIFLLVMKVDLINKEIVNKKVLNSFSTAALLEYAPYDMVIHNRDIIEPDITTQGLNNVIYDEETLNPNKDVKIEKTNIRAGYKIKYKTEDNEICVPIINYAGYETDIEDAEISTAKYGFTKISNIPNSGTVKVIYKGTLFQKLAWIGPSIYVMGIIVFLIAQKKKTRH